MRVEGIWLDVVQNLDGMYFATSLDAPGFLVSGSTLAEIKAAVLPAMDRLRMGEDVRSCPQTLSSRRV